MAISAHSVQPWAYAASGNISAPLPAHSPGDMLLVRVAFKSSAVATCVASCATTGWTKLGQFTGATNSGNGTGSVNLAVFYKQAATNNDPTPAVTFATAVTQVGYCTLSYSKGAGEVWSTPYAGVSPGIEFTATTSVNHVVSAAWNGAVLAGDLYDFWLAAADDTAITVPTMNHDSAVEAAAVEYPATAGIDTSGADGAYDGGYRLITTGAGSGTHRVAATLSIAETGTVWATRLRVTTASPYELAVAAISTGLFGHWRFGETTGIIAGNQVPGGSTLGYLNTPTLGVTGLLADDPDTAVTFARASQEDAYRGSGIAAGGSAGQSVAAWIQMGSFAAAESHSIWSWSAHSNTIGFHSLWFTATSGTVGTLQWFYSDGTSIRTATSSSFTPGTSTHFITVRHDYAAETVIFGIDGVEQTVDVSAFGPVVTIVSGKQIDIGGNVVNINQYFNGTIDEVAVWTVPITAGNVATLYAAGTAAAGAHTDLTASDTTSASDSLARLLVAIRTSADTISLTDAVVRQLALGRVLSESIPIGADSITRVIGIARTAVDTVTLGADSIARVQGLARAPPDTTATSESLARSLGLQRTAPDSVTSSDSILRVIGLTRSAADSTSLSESVARSTGVTSTTSDSTSLSESVARTTTLTRGATDSTTVADILNKGQSRTTSDTVSTTDSVARAGVFSRTSTDSVTSSDTLARTLGASRSFSDSVSSSESIASTRTSLRSAADSISTSETVARLLAGSRAASDTTTLSETIARLGVFTRSASDSTTVSDAIESLKRGPTQFLRPTSDLAGNWHGEDARSTSLYTSVDDSPFDDGTYIESPSNPTSSDFSELDLPSAADPAISSGHVVRYRYGGEGSATLIVELRQGTTVIASWSHIDPTTPTLAEQTLTGAEADAITDYADLRIRVRAA